MEGDIVPALTLSDFPKSRTWGQTNAAQRIIDQFNPRCRSFPIHVANRIAHFAKTGLPPSSKKSLTNPRIHRYFNYMFDSLGKIKQKQLNWEKWWVLAAIYGFSNPRLQPAVAEFSQRLGRPLKGMDYPGPIPAYISGPENDGPLDDNDGGGEEDNSKDNVKNPTAEGSLLGQNDPADLAGDMSDSTSALAIQQEHMVKEELLHRETICIDALDALHKIMGDSKSNKLEDNRTPYTRTRPSINNKRRLSDDISMDLSSDEEVYQPKKRQAHGVTLNGLEVRQASTEARLQTAEEGLKMEKKRREALEFRMTNLSNIVTVLKTQQGHERDFRELVAHNPGTTDVALLREVADKTMSNAVELNKVTKSLEEIRHGSGRQRS